MNTEINYQNNPLHGLSLKSLLTEIVDYYGYDILYAYLGINCFHKNPSIESSVKFLKKTQWAREKVELFYLYDYKNLPKASRDQFEIPPRDRIIPEGHQPSEPKKLSLEDAEQRKQEQNERAAEKKAFRKSAPPMRPRKERRETNTAPKDNNGSTSDPWAKWKE